MIPSAPLILTPDVIARFHRLRDFAGRRPVHLPIDKMEALAFAETPAYRKQMHSQTIAIPGPWPFLVTFTIETQPVGPCRHLSMSINRRGRVPSPEAVWMVAQEFGFSGSFSACTTWLEDLSNGEKALNLIQPLTVHAEVLA